MASAGAAVLVGAATLAFACGGGEAGEQPGGGAAARPATVSVAAPAAPPAPLAPESIATPLAAIGGGVHRPRFAGKADRGEVAVAPFLLEVHAVTNAQFAAFVRANPEWRRGRVADVFADRAYLAHWRDELEPGDDRDARPVTHVSWFAARAYARWIGRRLPTLAEWEVAAGAARDADADAEAVTRRILDWYARPARHLPEPVRSTPATEDGVFDLHGLVWEWVDDFGSALVTGESRADAGLERALFCGAGSVGAMDPSDYAAFMRYAFRSSLRAGYAIKNLGFRCATDVPVASAAAAAAEPPSCCDAEALPELPEPVASAAPAAPAAPAALPLPGASVWQLDATWRDQHGRERKLADLRGEVVVAAMVFTSCRYACPRLLQDVTALRAKMRAADRARVRVLLVSFDSERDTPPVLREWARERGLDDRFTLLHGDAAAVRELAAVLGVQYERAPSGDYAHANLLTVLDRAGVVVHRQTGLGADDAATLHAIGALLDAPRASAGAAPAPAAAAASPAASRRDYDATR